MLKHTSRRLLGLVLGSLPAVWLATTAYAQNGSENHRPAHPERTVRAALRVSPIQLDGRLDERIWLTAQPATDFIQTQPDEGESATQRTEVRFLFDDGAIYIGARMYDELGAEGVQSRLVRRDGFANSDELSITFDTFHDHLGRTSFSINPSGVKGDAFGPGSAFPDDSWDPVWEVETRVDSLGWTAEFRIPLSQLRFPKDSLQTWGLQVTRIVNRLNERSHWSFWRLNESGGPSRYGHLEGLVITASPGRAEILPYVVGRSANFGGTDDNNPFDNPHELDYRFGVDLKYLLTSNLTLTATMNPDFGQVEVDPAVVNLSDFETYFPERRPFFVEGRGFLRYGGLWCYFCSNTSGLSLFYSRRIGRTPQGSGNAYDAGEYADVPENTTILGAAKITGRTAGGWTIGLLDAVTGREHARVIGTDGSRFNTEVEPLTNYFAGTLGKDLRGGDLVVRAMATSVVRDLRNPAFRAQLNRHAEAAGLEVVSWWKDRTYRLAANFAASQIAGDAGAILQAQRSSARYFQRPDREHGGNGLFTDAYDSTLTSMRGFAGYARFSKEGGDWLWEVSTNFRSPGFEVNDLAFLTRADFVWMNANIFRQFTKPTKVFRRMSFIVGGQQRYNFDGDLTDRQAHAFFSIQLPNYWRFNTFFIRRFSVLDDRLTRGGPVVRRPSSNYWWVSLSTDSRKNLVLQTSPSYGCNSEGACDYSAGLNITFRPIPSISISLGPRFSHSESSAQFVKSVEDPTATAFFGQRYVLADLEQKSVSMNTRINVTFTPTLTLEVFAQPFISSGHYTSFKEFSAPREVTKNVYGQDVGTITADGSSSIVDPDGDGPAETFTIDDPNFNFRSLRGNAVLRWEFLPGSTLFLVWTQSRSISEPVADLNFGRDVSAMFNAPADNIFLVKVNYFLGF